MEIPETRYVKSGRFHIAYQVLGEGPFDLVFIPSASSHLEVRWEEPSLAKAYRRIASFSRLIMFDKRGTGLSDRALELPILEEQMDDVLAVMEAAGSERAALFGIVDGGALAMLFAATYPDRTRALITYGTTSKWLADSDYPWGLTSEMWSRLESSFDEQFGVDEILAILAPSRVRDDQFKAWLGRWMRLGAGPGGLLAVMRMMAEVDVRHVLPVIRVPMLVLHREGDGLVNVENARYLASNVPGAKLVELPGNDALFWAGDLDELVDEIQEFLTGVRPAPEPDRVLATMLFTDIVDSTKRAAELGDRRWRELMADHDGIVRQELLAQRGREVKTTGDGFLATFDGPARGIRCATAIRDAVRRHELEIRAGLHTGEIELIGDDVGGIGVHLAARVMAQAAAGEVLVSSTVKDLVAGSGIDFEDRGAHALKGVPGEWRLFAVTGGEGS